MSRRSPSRRDPLSRLAGIASYATVLPHHPCLACFRGDATRAVCASGDDNWLADFLIEVTGHGERGMTREAAANLVRSWPDPVATPKGRLMRVRLCRACANDARERIPGLPVHAATKLGRGHTIRPFTQPEPDVDMAAMLAILRQPDGEAS